MKPKYIDITGKKFFLLTTWTNNIKELDIVRETGSFIVQRNGVRFPKKSNHQFVGESRKAVKDKYLDILNVELVVRMEAVDSTRDRINQIKSLPEES